MDWLAGWPLSHQLGNKLWPNICRARKKNVLFSDFDSIRTANIFNELWMAPWIRIIILGPKGMDMTRKIIRLKALQRMRLAGSIIIELESNRL